MRISDWSSDVCSSDLMRKFHRNALTALILGNLAIVPAYALAQDAAPPQDAAAAQEEPAGEAGDDVTELQAVVVSGEIMRSEEHTSELQSLMRIPYAVFCLKKKK